MRSREFWRVIRSLVLAIADAIIRVIVPGEEYTATDRITNGGFTGQSPWTIQGASWTVGSGVATSAQDGGGLNQIIRLVNSGVSVAIAADITNANSALLTIRFLMDGAITQVAYADTPASGAFSTSVVATAEFNQVRFTATVRTGLVLDNVSLIA